MATDNKGIMVYLTPDLVDAIGQYCLDNGITRKIGDNEAAPSLGSGIAHYLKGTILNTVPASIESTVLADNNNGLSEGEVIDLIKKYNNNDGLSEKEVTDLIETKIESLPPAISIDDINQMIKSALLGLENTIKTQEVEINRLNTMVDNLVAPVEVITPIITSLSWGIFCIMISEPLPKLRDKKQADKMVALAETKGFENWHYDSKTKRFAGVK